MKTVIARFTELKENVAGTADSAFEDLDYNKVDKALKTVGVQLKDSTGQFRDLDEVFLELSSKWNTLDRNSQRYVATIAAGSRQQSRFIAMMENYERTMELVETAQNSAGKSSEQFGKYQDTVEYRVNQLKNTWEELRISFANSDFFKGALDALITFVKNVQKLTENKTAFVGFLVAISLSVKATITSLIQWVQRTILKAQAVIDGTKTTIHMDTEQPKTAKILLENIKKELNEINGTTAKAKVVVEENTDSNQSENQSSPSENQNSVIPSENDLPDNANNKPSKEKPQVEGQWKKAFKDAGRNFGTIFAGAFTSASAAFLMSNNPGEIVGNLIKTSAPIIITQIGSVVSAVIGLITGATEIIQLKTAAATMGISVVITAIAGLIAYAIKASEEDKAARNVETQIEVIEDKLEKLQSTISNTSEKVKELGQEKEDLNNLVDRYEELSNKVIKTDEEITEYNETIEKLKESYPELISYYDAENNQLKLSQNLIAEKNKRLEEELSLQNDLLYSQKLQQITAQAQQRELKAAKTIQDTTGMEIDATTLGSSNYQALLNNAITDVKITQETSKISYDNRGNTSNSTKNEPTVVFKTEEGSGSIDYQQLNGFIQKLDGLENEDINSLDTEQLENVQNAFEYVFGTEPLDDVKEEWRDAVEEMKVSISGLTEEVNDDFDTLYALQKERQDSLLGDTADDKNKALNAAEQAAQIGKINDIGFLEVSQNIDWQKGIEIDDITKHYKTFIENFQAKIATKIGKEESDLNIDKEKLAESYKDLYQAIAEGAWGNRDSFDDVKEQLIDKSNIEILEEAGITNQEEYEKWIGTNTSDEATQKKLAQLLYDNLIKQLADSGNIQKLTSKQRNKIIELTDYSEMTSKEYTTQYDAAKEDLREAYGVDDADNILSTILPDHDSIQAAVDTTVGIMGDSFAEKSIETSQVISSFYNEVITAGLSDFNAQKLTKQYTEALQSAGIKESDWAAFYQIDWTSLSNPAEYESWKKTQIEKMRDAGYDISEALFDELARISESSGYLDITISSTIELDAYIEKIKELQETVYDQKDTFMSAINEQIENGIISLETYQKLASSLSEIHADISDYATIDENGNITLDNVGLLNFYNDQIDTIKQLQEQKKKTQEELNSLKEIGILTEEQKLKEEELIRTLEEYDKKIEESRNLIKAYKQDSINSLQEVITTSKDALDKATEDEINTLKKLQDAQQDVNDKRKERNEAIRGAEFWDASIDDIYNYTTNLERVTKLVDKAKETLEDLSDSDDSQQAMQDYLDNVHQEMAVSEATIQTYQHSIENGQKVLSDNLIKEIQKINKEQKVNISTQLNDLYTTVGDRYNVDLNKLNQLEIPDDFKNMIVDEISSWNENLDRIEELQDNKLKRQKEFNELYKNSLSEMVDLQDKMMNTLKEKYQQEIDNLEDKYSAMEEADNDYLDALEKAIEKERSLRERENQWEDLANKERKLSLMQRDTSGGNLVETRQLEQEVQDDREQLLDSAIDDVIEGLRDIYELQQESRNAEIEYRNALLDEGMLMREVTAALANINTADDLVAWFYNNTANLSDMSEEQIKLEELNWRELFDAKLAYLETSQADFNSALTVTQQDISRVVNNTSETLTTKADSTLAQISDTVNENIATALKNLAEATEAQADAQEEYNKALEATAKAQEAYNRAIANFLSFTGQTGIEGITALSRQTIFGNKTINTNTTAGWEEQKSLIASARQARSKDDFYKTHSSYTQETLDGIWDKAQSNNAIFSTNSTIIYQSPETLFPDSQFNAVPIPKTNNTFIKNERKMPAKIEDILADQKLPGFKRTVFATGGLVDYTGPAWVDGKPNKPEAFLSSEDTKRIGEAARLLSNIDLWDKQQVLENISNTTVGDTIIDVTVNVENVSSDYDVDQAVERVKQDIVDAANYTGSNVILRKR